MSKTEAVSKFFEEAKDNADLRTALAGAESGEGIVEVAGRFGYDFERADLADFADFATEETEDALDETDLSKVAGGHVSERPRKHVQLQSWHTLGSIYGEALCRELGLDPNAPF